MSGSLGILIRLVLVPGLGFGLAKGGLLREGGRRALAFALVNVGYPLLILASLWQTDFAAAWAQSAFLVVFCAVFTGALFLLGRLFFRRRGLKDAALWNFMLGIGNLVYAGIPVLDIFLGPQAVALAVVYSAVGDIFIWTLHHPAVLAAGGGRPLSKLLFNPCFIALLVGLCLSLGGVPVPPVLAPALGYVTLAVSLVALFYVGAVLAGARLGQAFQNRGAWLLSLVKGVALPCACFFVAWPLVGLYTALVLGVMVSCPTPILSLVWAGDRPGARKSAVDCFVVSTLLYFVLVVPLFLVLQGTGVLALLSR